MSELGVLEFQLLQIGLQKPTAVSDLLTETPVWCFAGVLNSTYHPDCNIAGSRLGATRGRFNTHQGAEVCITPWWTPFQGIAGIAHHPNLNPEGDAGFCWSLPETSKLNETSRTPVISARTTAEFDAALMRFGSESPR